MVTDGNRSAGAAFQHRVWTRPWLHGPCRVTSGPMALPAGRSILAAMRITRAHVTRAHARSQIITTPQPDRHWVTRRAPAPPDGAEPATRAEATTPARALVRAASAGASPAAFLAAHPCAYVLSLVGSGAAAVYGLTAARQDARHRVLRLAVGAHCTAQFAGIVIATEVARRRTQPADYNAPVRSSAD